MSNFEMFMRVAMPTSTDTSMPTSPLLRITPPTHGLGIRVDKGTMMASVIDVVRVASCMSTDDAKRAADELLSCNPDIKARCQRIFLSTHDISAAICTDWPTCIRIAKLRISAMDMSSRGSKQALERVQSSAVVVPSPQTVQPEVVAKHTADVLAAAFADLHPEMHRDVGRYHLDLYIERVNIAVVCESKIDNDVMASEVANALQCACVSYNPDASEFRIGPVVKRIHDLVVAKAMGDRAQARKCACVQIRHAKAARADSKNTE